MDNQNVLSQLAALIAENQPDMQAWVPANLSPEIVKAAEKGEVGIDGNGMFGMTCVLVGLICMAGSTAYFYVAANRAKGDKFFEVLTMMITGIATCAYLTMYSGAGYSWIPEKTDSFSPFYWARYIDWLLTTPLMVWDVLALAGAPNDEILMCVGIDMLMILFGVVGAQTPEHQKWWFFIIGCLCFVHVVQTLLKYRNVGKYGEVTRALYNKVAMLTIVLWTFYPIVWVVAEGTRLVSASLEACLYMIMDVTSKCVFGFMIVNARSALESVSNTSETQPLMGQDNAA